MARSEAAPGAAGALVLVVDDDARMRRFVGETLELAGYSVSLAPDAETAERLLAERPPDLVLLDVVMPDRSGLDLLRRLRADEQIQQVGVIMLTGRDDEDDKITALESGADDYLTKPFAARELVARARAVLRRTRGNGAGPSAEEAAADLALVPGRRALLVEGREVPLTGTEYKLLAALLRARGRVHTPGELGVRVWGASYVDAGELVRTNIYRLRKKIEDDPKQPRFVCSRPGVGYYIPRRPD